MTNFDIYDDELRYARHAEIEKNYLLREELKKKYNDVFNYDELMKYVFADKKVKNNVDIRKIVNDIETENVDKIIKLNKGNVTVEALIAWKMQDIKTNQLISAFYDDYRELYEKKWWRYMPDGTVTRMTIYGYEASYD
jgi:hypothetical protein